MTVGIVGSGPDMLTLFRVLQAYDHDYIVYYDDLLWPYGDKPAKLVQAVIQDAINVLRKRGCTQIILPPIWELVFREQADILPIFQTYLQEYCFKHSLVGKIGLIGDWSDIQIAQGVLEKYASAYTLTKQQQSIQKFHKPFVRRCKEAQMWKYFLAGLSYSNPMVNKIVKNDLRYFKDADVDTLIPLNYGYFRYQSTISKFLNHKKCRFHKLEVLQTICDELLKGGDMYKVSILYTGQKELLERQKKLMRLLQRGKQVEIQREKI